MTKHTDVIVILDSSGSMSSMKSAAEEGFNKLIADQRKIEGTCNVTLVTFDSSPIGQPNIKTVYTGKPVAKVPALQLTPGGGTPLLDAIGQTVSQVEAQIAALPVADRPEQVAVIIITDGDENTSREYTQPVIKSLLERKQRDGWQIVYLGANVDAFTNAQHMGIAVASAAPYAASQRGLMAAYGSVSANLASYRSDGRNMQFNTQQREDLTAGETSGTSTTDGSGSLTP